MKWVNDFSLLSSAVFRTALTRLLGTCTSVTSEELVCLIQWEKAGLPLDYVGEFWMTRWLLAVQTALALKGQYRNNLRAAIYQRLSHSPSLDDWAPTATELLEMRKCDGCATRKWWPELYHAQLQAEIREQIHDRFLTMKRLEDPAVADSLIGTHLTEVDVSGLVGHSINVSRELELVETCCRQSKLVAERLQGFGWQRAESDSVVQAVRL